MPPHIVGRLMQDTRMCQEDDGTYGTRNPGCASCSPS